MQDVAVECPYCGEQFETAVDCSGGSQNYIEDCRVCCQPIEVHLQVAPDGTLAGLLVYREDD